LVEETLNISRTDKKAEHGFAFHVSPAAWKSFANFSEDISITSPADLLNTLWD